MDKLKVITVVGTRPEIIRLSSVIRTLESSPAINHILIHTGQNYDYELNEVFFNDFNLRKPDYFLDSSKDSPMAAIGSILAKIDPILKDENPDALLVLGDTNSCLSALAAKRRKIPIFHMEAGNRCFDQRVPEETNRKIVDHISDINLPYSAIARDYLIKEGFPVDRIIKTGSPMFEVLMSKKKAIDESKILETLSLESKQYFVVSYHREENVDDDQQLLSFIDSLNAIADHYQLKVIFSTHPRTKKVLEAKGIKINSLVQFHKPFGFVDYVKLQLNSKAVLSDSGTINEESSILGFKALNIRNAHERPEAMEQGAVMMVGTTKERILQGLSVLNADSYQTPKIVDDYTIENVSEKVLKIILSYTDYVNRVVWNKR